MKYDVVSDNRLDMLIDQVNKKLEEGWELQGGLCIGSLVSVSGSMRDGDGSIESDGTYEYAQALVKR